MHCWLTALDYQQWRRHECGVFLGRYLDCLRSAAHTRLLLFRFRVWIHCLVSIACSRTRAYNWNGNYGIQTTEYVYTKKYVTAVTVQYSTYLLSAWAEGIRNVDLASIQRSSQPPPSSKTNKTSLSGWLQCNKNIFLSKWTRLPIINPFLVATSEAFKKSEL